jgi:Uma2 family endonuclease
MVALRDRLLMTYEEYLDWEPHQECRHEFWNGEVVSMVGVTRNHNRVSGNFFKLLDDALADRPCEVYIADVKVQIQPRQKYFYPDVVVTCDESDRADPQMVSSPCLVIEVLSPSTEAFDRGFKFSQYRKFASLQEYVLVQVDLPTDLPDSFSVVEMFRRNNLDQWVLFEYAMCDRLLLESVNVEIAVRDLYRQVQFDNPVKT